MAWPSDDEIKARGWIRPSPNTRDAYIGSRPRVGQVYWIDFPRDHHVPEIVGMHMGVVVRAAPSLLHSTCVVAPITSAEQKFGTHFHQLGFNPNPDGHFRGITAFVLCDHLYTVNVCRLRPINRKGKIEFPRIGEPDRTEIFRKIAVAFDAVAQAAVDTHLRSQQSGS